MFCRRTKNNDIVLVFSPYLRLYFLDNNIPFYRFNGFSGKNWCNKKCNVKDGDYKTKALLLYFDCLKVLDEFNSIFVPK